MLPPRKLLLFDPGHYPQTWNERMGAGEYAVHYSHFAGDTPVTPYCLVFPDLDQALAYAQDEVKRQPSLRCTIYDHQGLIGPPIRDIRGVDFKDGEISARLRRWIGSTLFFGGAGLTIYDWARNFQLQWPSTIGMRMVVPGLTLLFVELLLSLHKRLPRRAGVEAKRVA